MCGTHKSALSHFLEMNKMSVTLPLLFQLFPFYFEIQGKVNKSLENLRKHRKFCLYHQLK